VKQQNDRTTSVLFMLYVTAIFLFASGATNAEEAKSTEDSQPHHEKITPPDAFNKMIHLAGRWQGTQNSAEGVKPVVVEYALTAGDTALIETLFPGSPNEMVSVYHGDGEDVLMTHYCVMGNQPRMQLEKSEDPKVMKFVYKDGTSMSSADDPHMHQLIMTLIDEDHIKHEWSFYAGGQPTMTVVMNLTRDTKTTD